MKKDLRIFRPVALIGIGLVLAVVSAAVSQPAPAASDSRAVAVLMQATVTPTAESVSEIGSTDGIVLMGVIIVLIVVIPMLVSRKTWGK